MSQPNSGELELKVDEAIKKIHAELDSLNETACLRIMPVADISMYINYDDEILKHMDADEIGTAAYMVSRHAAYVKKLSNRHNAIARWAKSALNTLAVKRAKEYVDVKYLKMEEKVAVVVAENDYARELNKHMMAAELKTTELYDLYDQLNKLSDKLTEIQRTKRSERFQR